MVSQQASEWCIVTSPGVLDEAYDEGGGVRDWRLRGGLPSALAVLGKGSEAKPAQWCKAAILQI